MTHDVIIDLAHVMYTLHHGETNYGQEIIKKAEDGFEVKVREKPVRGKANKAVIEVLSKYFNVPMEKIRLIRGFRERSKIFEI